MSDLISPDAKLVYRERLRDVYDTFKRPHLFTLYKAPTETVVSIDEDYSINWGSTAYGNNNITYTEEKAQFYARIWFPTFPQKFLTYQPDDVDVRVKMAQDTGSVKIQCLEDCYNFLIQAERAVFFGNLYRLDSDVRRLGIFDMELFSFTMAKQN